MKFIRTYTGKRVDLQGAPNPNSVDIMDIATALSKLHRFNGHLLETWTVAEHSILCSFMSDDPVMKMALLTHDFHEFVLGDIPSPVKAIINSDPLFQLQTDINWTISEALGKCPMQFVTLDAEQNAEVQRIDRGIGRLEAQCLLPGYREEEWEAADLLSDEEMMKAAKYILHMIGDHESVHSHGGRDPFIWIREKLLRRFSRLQLQVQEGVTETDVSKEEIDGFI